ncbi:unnamed protein product [Cylindrotheca closterium]|uniref:2Fe-2S ferredoxin-type domain-containing protein n=1 Tax=Cylindrotheca closterium TaxID=2856 RepID=A0AAD2G3I4_9STRA|nr:unnamed protein product [Cylindrotheca closterium]
MKTFFTILITLIICLSAEAFTTSTTTNAAALPPTQASWTTSSSTSLQMTVLSYNGKKKDFKAGSPLKTAVAQLGVKPRYSCKKGECATCQISLAGRMTKPCVAKVPPEPTLKSLKEKGLEIKA